MFRIFKRRVKFYVWKNNDGSPGGEVSVDANVHPSATIERYATVLPGVTIGENGHVKRGDIIDKDGIFAPFNSIHNSENALTPN